MSVSVGDGDAFRPARVAFSWLSAGWDLFKRDSMTWILAVLVAGFLEVGVSMICGMVLGQTTPDSSENTLLSLWNLNVPHSGREALDGLADTAIATIVAGGLFRMALRQLRGQAIGVGDLFSVVDVLGPLLGLSVITWVLVSLGSLLFYVPGLIVQGLLLFAPLYIVAEDAGPMDAVLRSFHTLKRHWLMAAIFFFVGTLLIILSVVRLLRGRNRGMGRGYLEHRVRVYPVPPGSIYFPTGRFVSSSKPASGLRRRGWARPALSLPRSIPRT